MYQSLKRPRGMLPKRDIGSLTVEYFTPRAALSALIIAGPANAAVFGTTTVVEDSVTGYVGAIPTSSPAIMVASDGEAAFQPFGLTFDVSDAIMLNESWAPDPTYASAFGANGWQQAPNTFIWY